MNANKNKATAHAHTKNFRFYLKFFVVSEKTVKKAHETMAEGRPNEQGSLF